MKKIAASQHTDKAIPRLFTFHKQGLTFQIEEGKERTEKLTFSVLQRMADNPYTSAINNY